MTSRIHIKELRSVRVPARVGHGQDHTPLFADPLLLFLCHTRNTTLRYTVEVARCYKSIHTHTVVVTDMSLLFFESGSGGHTRRSCFARLDALVLSIAYDGTA